MSERTVWTCDGCDDEVIVSGGDHGDWQIVTVAIQDTRTEYEANDYHLCRHCQKQLKDRANPRTWPRAKAAPYPGSVVIVGEKR